MGNLGENLEGFRKVERVNCFYWRRLNIDLVVFCDCRGGGRNGEETADGWSFVMIGSRVAGFHVHLEIHAAAASNIIINTTGVFKLLALFR